MLRNAYLNRQLNNHNFTHCDTFSLYYARILLISIATTGTLPITNQQAYQLLQRNLVCVIVAI